MTAAVGGPQDPRFDGAVRGDPATVGPDAHRRDVARPCARHRKRDFLPEQIGDGGVAVPAQHRNLQHRAFADEPGDRLVRRPAVYPLRAVDLREPAVEHDGDAVGQRHRLGLVVGDVDHGRAGFAMEGAEHVHHCNAQMGIEIGQRFVQNDDLGLHDQTTGERDPLALTAREFGRLAFAEAGKADRLQRLLDGRIAIRAVHFRDPQRITDIAGHGQVRPQGVLEHHADAASFGEMDSGVGVRPDRIPVDDPACRRGLKPGDQTQDRRLAAT